MQAGRLNTFLTLQSKSTAQDAVGQPSTVWTTVATLWADVRTTGGLETIKAGADTSVLKASIRVRAGIAFNASQRLVADDGAVFEIQAVLPDRATRQHVDLVCEVVA